MGRENEFPESAVVNERRLKSELNVLEHKEILHAADQENILASWYWNIGRMSIWNPSKDKISEQRETKMILFANWRFSHAKVKYCNYGSSQGRNEALELLVWGGSRCLAEFNKFDV